jgi:alkylated DNA repair dioxygenase AlkB
MNLIPIAGAEIYYDDHFLPPEEATQLFNTLLSKCAWERRRASFGHVVPRDEAYYGNPGTHYTYSQREYKPLPWIVGLLSLKVLVEEATPMAAYTNSGLPKLGYNAVLCNLYRDGNDSVGLHADSVYRPQIAAAPEATGVTHRDSFAANRSASARPVLTPRTVALAASRVHGGTA